jgi:hypothetical protein
MSIVIKKKNPVAHGIKVAIATVAIFVIIGLVVKFTKKSNQEIPNPSQSFTQLLTGNSHSLIPSIRLHVLADAPENAWVAALSEFTGGTKELKVAFGRADVLTDNYAIEVDFLRKWKEGLGQALHYGDVTKLIPVLALIAPNPVDKDMLKQIEGLCTKQGVKLILLVPDN